MKRVSKYYKKYKSRRNKLILKVVGKTAAFITSFVVAGSLLFHGFHGIKSLFPEKSTEEVEIENQVEQEVPEEVETSVSSNEIVEPIETAEILTPTEEETVEEQVSYYISSELLDSGYEFKDVDFEKLTQENDDIVGWVQIDNTKVDYAIYQDEDNEYYSHHDENGNSTKSGSIFLDANNELLSNPTEELDDLNFIYGHHMANGSMFSAICSYKKQSFVDENPFFVIYTDDGYAYKCDIFAGVLFDGVTSHLYNNYQDFADEESFQEYINYINENSMITTDVEVSYDDKIVALVTCSYENGINGDLRFVVFAKMTKQYTDENSEEIRLERKIK